MRALRAQHQKEHRAHLDPSGAKTLQLQHQCHHGKKLDHSVEWLPPESSFGCSQMCLAKGKRCNRTAMFSAFATGSERCQLCTHRAPEMLQAALPAHPAVAEVARRTRSAAQADKDFFQISHVECHIRSVSFDIRHIDWLIALAIWSKHFRCGTFEAATACRGIFPRQQLSHCENACLTIAGQGLPQAGSIHGIVATPIGHVRVVICVGDACGYK